MKHLVFNYTSIGLILDICGAIILIIRPTIQTIISIINKCAKTNIKNVSGEIVSSDIFFAFIFLLLGFILQLIGTL